MVSGSCCKKSITEGMNMRERLYRFMQGRYGTDQFTSFLVWFALILWFVTRFISHTRLSGLFSLLAALMVIYADYRIFSKNCTRRYRENERYLMMTGRIRRYIQKWRHQRQLRRGHRIFKCPSCHQKIRVPKGKGKIAITCPGCRTEFIRRS